MKASLIRGSKSLTSQLWYLGIALLLLTLWMSSMTLASLRAQLMDSIVDQANVVADNIAPALQFEDNQHSELVLSSLSGNRAIAGAMLLDNRYQVKAFWTREVDLRDWLDSGLLAVPDDYAKRVVVYPIEIDRSVMGQLVIVITHQYLFQRVLTNLMVTLFAISLVLLLAFLLLRRADKALRLKEQALHQQAHYDNLTSLPNRNSLLQDLKSRISKKLYFHLLFIDIDHFKQVNDGHGHATGDQLLCELVTVWKHLLPNAVGLYRQGNDEFILVIDDVNLSPQDIARQLSHRHKLPVLVNHHEFFLSLTMGAVSFPQDGEELSALLRHLDIALHTGKATRRGKLTLFSPQLLETSRQRAQLLGELQHALERDEFLLYFQPQVDLKTGQCVGVEALIRWRDDQGRLIAPNQFVPLAEESGLIVPIGSWVLREACRIRKVWLDLGVIDLVMAVNLSARQFHEEDLPSMMQALLKEFALPADLLVLEVTESLLMNNISKVVSDLALLRSLGIQIAIDDFGTGYSSMAYLQQLPIDYLKIDRSFVQHLHQRSKDQALVKTMLQLAHNLELQVVAEGIENEQQAQFLTQLGCQKGQGYWYGKPMTAVAFMAMIESGHVEAH